MYSCAHCRKYSLKMVAGIVLIYLAAKSPELNYLGFVVSVILRMRKLAASQYWDDCVRREDDTEL